MRSRAARWIRCHRIASFVLLAHAIAWGPDLPVSAFPMEPPLTRWLPNGLLGALTPAVAVAVGTGQLGRRDARAGGHPSNGGGGR